MITIAALLIGSYILGSVPFGVLFVKACCGIDIRQYGSGNIGATNVMRAAGKPVGVTVFVLDVLKGVIPVVIANNVLPGPAYTWIPLLCGLFALIGHTASVFLRFHGGKGVATGLGIFIGINPGIAFSAFGIWIILAVITKYVSFASIIAASSIPAMMFIFNAPMPHKLLAVGAAAYVVIKHRSNIVRLTQGKEPKWGEKPKDPEE